MGHKVEDKGRSIMHLLYLLHLVKMHILGLSDVTLKKFPVVVTIVELFSQ